MTKPRILVVAEEAALRATLARWLMGGGYAVELAESPKRASEIIANARIAVGVLAAGGLGTAAAALARELADQAAHVLILETQPGDDKAPGQAIQADDYVPLPLNEQEVLARVATALGGAPTPELPDLPQRIRFEGYTLDIGGRSLVGAKGEEVALTRAEFTLLSTLAYQAGRVMSRDELTRAVAGRPAEPDDRTVDVLVSRLRRKIEPDPKAPRIIITAPGEGYKLAAKMSAAPRSNPIAASSPDDQSAAVDAEKARDKRAAPAPATSVSRGAAFRWVAGTAALALTIGLAFWYQRLGITNVDKRTEPVRPFDAAAVPLVKDAVRAQLSTYRNEPGSKAIAISREGWGISSGAANEDAAKTEAIERCHERDKGGFCRIYAVGDNVVWPQSTLSLPLPADIRSADPSSPSLTAEGLDKIWQAVWRNPPPPVAARYVESQKHKALAVSLPSLYASSALASAEEASRVAIERCSDLARTPCLLLFVDGALTTVLPHSYRIAGPFTLAGDREMSEADRQRIARVYAGKDWRALARGKSGGWFAVDGRESEANAVEEAVQSCRRVEPDCALYAIGNWRVGEKVQSNSQ